MEGGEQGPCASMPSALTYPPSPSVKFFKIVILPHVTEQTRAHSGGLAAKTRSQALLHTRWLDHQQRGKTQACVDHGGMAVGAEAVLRLL